MKINHVLFHVIKMYYFMSLLLVVPFSLIFIYAFHKELASETMPVSWKLGIIAYIALGIFIFKYKGARKRELKNLVSEHKANGFTPTFELYNRYSEKYVGWSSTKNQFLYFDPFTSTLIIGTFDELLTISFENHKGIADNGVVKIVTAIPRLPTAYLEVRRDQANLVEVEMVKWRTGYKPDPAPQKRDGRISSDAIAG